MTSILRNKFQQNPELAAVLINTDDKNLHEATSDPKWATGAELASKSLLNSDWYGQDLLGQLLELVRTDLITKQQQQLATADQEGPPPPLPPSQANLETDQPQDLPDEITPLPDGPADHSTTHAQYQSPSRLHKATTENTGETVSPYSSSSPRSNSDHPLGLNLSQQSQPSNTSGVTSRTKGRGRGEPTTANTAGRTKASRAGPPRPPPPQRSTRATLAAARAASSSNVVGRGRPVINC